MMTRNDPLAKEVEGVPLGHCLDASRLTTDVLTQSQQKFVDDVRTGIGGDDGVVAAAELECILRGSFTDFCHTSTAHIKYIRSLARESRVEIPSSRG